MSGERPGYVRRAAGVFRCHGADQDVRGAAGDVRGAAGDVRGAAGVCQGSGLGMSGERPGYLDAMGRTMDVRGAAGDVRGAAGDVRGAAGVCQGSGLVMSRERPGYVRGATWVSQTEGRISEEEGSLLRSGPIVFKNRIRVFRPCLGEERPIQPQNSHTHSHLVHGPSAATMMFRSRRCA